jgi:hypothetical protein
MMAYIAFEKTNTSQQASYTLSHQLIEKAIKTYKTHRSAADFDVKFVRNLINELGEEKATFVKMVVTKMKEEMTAS